MSRAMRDVKGTRCPLLCAAAGSLGMEVTGAGMARLPMPADGDPAEVDDDDVGSGAEGPA